MLSGSTLKPLTDSPPSEFTLILSRRGLKVSWGIVAGVGGGGGWNVAPFDWQPFSRMVSAWRLEFLCKQHMPAHTSLFLPSYAAWMNEWQPGPCLTDWLPVVLEPCAPNEVGHSLLSRTINIFALTPSKLEIQCRITRVSSLRTIKRFTVLVVELRCEDAVLENARSLDKTQQIIKK